MLKAQLKRIFVKKPFEKRFKIHGLRANRLDTSGDLIDSVDIILRKLAYILAGLRVSRNEKCTAERLDLFKRVEICLHVIYKADAVFFECCTA